MQVPYRKPGKQIDVATDPIMTQEKFETLSRELKKLLADRPHQANEVHRLAQNGDFSENAEYQQAKSKLRGMNARIEKIQYQIDHATVIAPPESETVEIGSTVTVIATDETKPRTYTILGSTEVDPARNIISYTSPIGNALLGKQKSDTVSVPLPSRTLELTIVSIE